MQRLNAQAADPAVRSNIMETQQIASASPFGLALTILMGVLLLALPRKHAIIPLAFITCYTTFGQNIYIAGMNFYMLRVLVLFGFLRLLVRQDARSFGWMRMDTAVLAWSTWSVIAYTLLWQTSASLINALGYAYDALGLYFLSRALIREVEDIKHVCRVFAVMLVPLALCICVEKATGRNPFYVLGGVPEFTELREGVLRCQGPFRHPILAGSFGAAWFPLFVGLWWQGRGNRAMALLGIASSGIITLLSGSSGPVGSLLAAVVGLMMWRFRNYMRLVRWGFVLSIIALDVVMKDPVWFIFARFRFFSGSTGWHRSWLIDRTIANFSDWWLVGTKSVAEWGVYAGDVTNHFIEQGARSGFFTLLLFVWVVVLAFSQIGRAVRGARNELRKVQMLVWAVGCSLLAHLVNFWNVSYFDQNVVNWYLALTMSTAAFAVYCRASAAKKVEVGATDVGDENLDLVPALPEMQHPQP
ncbi:MAG TPA: hypothetical protein VFA60_09015 [Terriglobales bacterium]|nr:hypothetical protein [Terriglobales bacterium]